MQLEDFVMPSEWWEVDCGRSILRTNQAGVDAIEAGFAHGDVYVTIQDLCGAAVTVVLAHVVHWARCTNENTRITAFIQEHVKAALADGAKEYTTHHPEWE